MIAVMPRSRGRLIVFEGVEGAGKSTQLDRLASQLTRARISHVTLREPGGTPLGDEIRRLLLDPRSKVSARAEALLFMASRAELVAREVRPALAAGTTVLLDRFFLSTYAYQIGGRGLPEADVRATNLMATEGLVPDLTLLLTLDSSVGLARVKLRGSADRIEASGDVFHARVALAFTEFSTPAWQATHEECGPIVAVDAAGGPADVETRVYEVVAARLPELGALRGAVA
jgi:dTMP kinase